LTSSSRWFFRFRGKRLTPRGEPRQTAVVGVENRCPRDDYCAEYPSQQQRSPAVGSVTAPATSSECLGAFRRTASCPSATRRSLPVLSVGREQPPGLDRVSTPTPARRVAHAPMSAPECSRVPAAICAPKVRVLSRANAPQILAQRAVLLNDHSRQKSAITSSELSCARRRQGSRCPRPCGLRP
jgi:hypothetical protein